MALETKQDKKELIPVSQEESKALIKKGKTYTVNKKTEGDTNLYQRLANERGISTQVIERGQSEKDQMAYCTVRAIAPNGQFVESCVYFDYYAIKEAFLFDLIDKNSDKIIQEYDPEGRPILKLEYQKRLFKRFIRWRLFAVRDAESKAARRAQLKILNREWRESEELDFEQFEINTVEQGKKDNKPESKQEKKNVIQRLVNRVKTEKLPQYKLKNPDQEHYFGMDYQDRLMELATNPRAVFPPTDISQLHEVCSKDLPFTFLIRDTHFGGFSFGHWNKDRLDKEALTIRMSGGKKITLYLNNYTGRLEIAYSSEKEYGSNLTDYLKATGFGINWFLAEKTVYDALKREEKESKTGQLSIPA